MKPSLRSVTAAIAMAVAVVAVRADVPHIYAVKGARIVPVAGAAIPSGTIVMRNGVIEAVGASVDVPKDARVIEGAGLTVYPGLIDMGSSAGVDQTLPPQPANLRTTEEAERWKRTQIFRPDFDIAAEIRAEAAERNALRQRRDHQRPRAAGRIGRQRAQCAGQRRRAGGRTAGRKRR